jgi:hypothetical protein
MYFTHKIIKNKKIAQSLAEVAIFGAIMMFMVGMILKAGMQGSAQMNQELRAMRIAMLWSFQAASQTSARRNNASILLIEDRLWVDPGGKYFTPNRMPMMSNALVIHGKNLFMPVSYGDYDDLPVFDLFVNGVHFEFWAAMFKSFYLTPKDLAIPGVPLGTGIPRCAGATPVTGASGIDYYPSTCWDQNCSAWEDLNGGDTNGDGDPLEPEEKGCARLPSVVGNYKASEYWNPANAGAFDLNFDGTPDVTNNPDPTCNAGQPLRNCFAWQWRTIQALAGNINPDPQVQTNVNVDVDNDYKEEYVLNIGTKTYTTGTDPETGVPITASGSIITTVGVIDYGAGDYDGSWDDRDDDRFGKKDLTLQKDTRMYSLDRNGTIYEVREGKLFGIADGQYVRTTNRQDHVDIIQRVFQLANNTGRFCHWTGVRFDPTPGSPVEVCAADPNNCNTPANIDKICMDTDDLKLYVRSRIYDTRQRRWVTRVAP